MARPLRRRARLQKDPGLPDSDGVIGLPSVALAVSPSLFR